MLFCFKCTLSWKLPGNRKIEFLFPKSTFMTKTLTSILLYLHTVWTWFCYMFEKCAFSILYNTVALDALYKTSVCCMTGSVGKWFRSYIPFAIYPLANYASTCYIVFLFLFLPLLLSASWYSNFPSVLFRQFILVQILSLPLQPVWVTSLR